MQTGNLIPDFIKTVKILFLYLNNKRIFAVPNGFILPNGTYKSGSSCIYGHLTQLV